MAKDSFILYDTYAEQLEFLNNEQAGILFKSIFSYRNNKPLPDMDSAVKMAYLFIISQINRDTDRYNHICEQRSIAGAKGGAPKGNQNALKQPKQANGCIDNEEENNEDIIENNQNKQMVEKTSKTSKTSKNKQNKHYEYEYEYDIKKKVNNKLFTKKEKQPPTLEDVRLYAEQRGREDLAQPFFDFFDAGNWYDSTGAPVKNWKQKFITWETHNPKKEEKPLRNTSHFANERIYTPSEYDSFYTRVEDIDI